MFAWSNKVVHVNLIVPFVDRLAKVCRVVLVAEDNGCDLVAGKLVGDALGAEQEADVSRLAEQRLGRKFSQMLGADLSYACHQH